MAAGTRNDPGHWFEAQPLWFKTAVFYEIHTRAFFDANGGKLPTTQPATVSLTTSKQLGHSLFRIA